MPETCDIAILIPLPEEFRECHSVVKDRIKQQFDDDVGNSYFAFEIAGNRIVLTMMGGAGEVNAAIRAAQVIAYLRPKHLVVLGIAGAIDNLKPGDVVIATSIDRFLENSKAVPIPGKAGAANFEFELSGEAFRADAKVLNRMRNFEFNHSSAFEAWQRRCRQRAEQYITKESGAIDLISELPVLIDGKIASGPTVSGANSFKAFLLKKDRKFMAVEMESGGAFQGVESTGNRECRLSVIRGISDLSDENKKKLDNAENLKGVSKSIFRKYAVRNAFDCAIAFIESGIFKPSTTGGGAPEFVNVKSTDWENVASLEQLLRALENHFEFGWERGSFVQTEKTSVYWPVTLREPTPIHAIQAFAAAAMQSFGVEIQLCLDDLGNCGTSPDIFTNAAKKWFENVGADYGKVQTKLFSSIIRDQLDAWPAMQKWLGETDERVKSILEIAKIIESRAVDEDLPKAIREKRPRRLLKPATVWTVLEQLCEASPTKSFITLGGVDERILWKTWRKHIFSGHIVGHLYNPKLGKEAPVHMAETKLNWDSRESVLDAFTESLRKESSDELDSNALIPWTVRGCYMLPSFVKAKFKLDEHETPDLRGELGTHKLRELAQKASQFLF